MRSKSESKILGIATYEGHDIDHIDRRTSDFERRTESLLYDRSPSHDIRHAFQNKRMNIRLQGRMEHKHTPRTGTMTTRLIQYSTIQVTTPHHTQRNATLINRRHETTEMTDSTQDGAMESIGRHPVRETSDRSRISNFCIITPRRFGSTNGCAADGRGKR